MCTGQGHRRRWRPDKVRAVNVVDTRDHIHTRDDTPAGDNAHARDDVPTGDDVDPADSDITND
ncbi:MAG: hypothetical protein ACRDQA_06035 [Nocardioidaceae bacterium]